MIKQPVPLLPMVNYCLSPGEAYYREKVLSMEDVSRELSHFDLKRLASYANQMLDHHVILDLLPCLANWYFMQRFPSSLELSGVQKAVMMALALQKKSIEGLEVTFSLLFFLLKYLG